MMKKWILWCALPALMNMGYSQSMPVFSETLPDGGETTGRKEDGKKQGLWITYDANRNIKRLEEFKEDKRHGWFLENDEHGHPFLQGLFYEGKPVGKHTATNHGMLVSEMDYDQGTVKEFHQDGSTKKEGFLLNGLPHGKFVQYYENGKKLSETTYVNGKKTGTQKYYYQSGILQAEYETADDNLNGLYREFHPEGALAAEGRYENNLKQGIWKEFDPTGKLTRQTKYKNDVEVK